MDVSSIKSQAMIEYVRGRKRQQAALESHLRKEREATLSAFRRMFGMEVASPTWHEDWLLLDNIALRLHRGNHEDQFVVMDIAMKTRYWRGVRTLEQLGAAFAWAEGDKDA